MFLDVLSTVIVCVIVNYLMLVPVFYFVLGERVNNVDNIIASRNPRKRVDLAKNRESMRRDRVVAFLWPILFIRGSVNAPRKKK